MNSLSFIQAGSLAKLRWFQCFTDSRTFAGTWRTRLCWSFQGGQWKFFWFRWNDAGWEIDILTCVAAWAASLDFCTISAPPCYYFWLEWTFFAMYNLFLSSFGSNRLLKSGCHLLGPVNNPRALCNSLVPHIAHTLANPLKILHLFVVKMSES